METLRSRFVIFVIVLLSLVFVSCSDSAAETPASAGYELNDLYDYFGEIPYNETAIYETAPIKRPYRDANARFPGGQDTHKTEFIRFTSYPVSGGGVFHVFWSYNLTPEGEPVPLEDCFALFSFYESKLLTEDDFASIEKGAAATDVGRIDPGMEMHFTGSTGPYSYHVLEGNRLLKIKYSYSSTSGIHSRDSLVVASKSIIAVDSQDHNGCYAYYAIYD